MNGLKSIRNDGIWGIVPDVAMRKWWNRGPFWASLTLPYSILLNGYPRDAFLPPRRTEYLSQGREPMNNLKKPCAVSQLKH